MSTDLVMTLIAAVVVVMALRSESVNKFHAAALWIFGIYCGSITWIGPNVRHFLAGVLHFLASHLTSH
ncbi:hypothetical protein [Kitasatospora sp. HPMI-4]|uniref:hypothetical protein n=1 Tax=Kitasatospora sp. HPMI-4 TaxID=3448443 RepID=UPI003F1D1A76